MISVEASAEGKAMALPKGDVMHTQSQYPSQPGVAHYYTVSVDLWVDFYGWAKDLTHCYPADALIPNRRNVAGALGPWQPNHSIVWEWPIGGSIVRH